MKITRIQKKLAFLCLFSSVLFFGLAFSKKATLQSGFHTQEVQAQASCQQVTWKPGETPPASNIFSSQAACQTCGPVANGSPACLTISECVICNNGSMTPTSLSTCGAAGLPCGPEQAACSPPSGTKVLNGEIGWYNIAQTVCARCVAGVMKTAGVKASDCGAIPTTPPIDNITTLYKSICSTNASGNNSPSYEVNLCSPDQSVSIYCKGGSLATYTPCNAGKRCSFSTGKCELTSSTPSTPSTDSLCTVRVANGVVVSIPDQYKCNGNTSNYCQKGKIASTETCSDGFSCDLNTGKCVISDQANLPNCATIGDSCYYNQTIGGATLCNNSQVPAGANRAMYCCPYGQSSEYDESLKKHVCKSQGGGSSTGSGYDSLCSVTVASGVTVPIPNGFLCNNGASSHCINGKITETIPCDGNQTCSVSSGKCETISSDGGASPIAEITTKPFPTTPKIQITPKPTPIPEKEPYCSIFKSVSCMMSGLKCSPNSKGGSCEAEPTNINRCSGITLGVQCVNNTAYTCVLGIQAKANSCGALGCNEKGNGCNDSPPPEENQVGSCDTNQDYTKNGGVAGDSCCIGGSIPECQSGICIGNGTGTFGTCTSTQLGGSTGGESGGGGGMIVFNGGQKIGENRTFTATHDGVDIIPLTGEQIFAQDVVITEGIDPLNLIYINTPLNVSCTKKYADRCIVDRADGTSVSYAHCYWLNGQCYPSTNPVLGGGASFPHIHVSICSGRFVEQWDGNYLTHVDCRAESINPCGSVISCE